MVRRSAGAQRRTAAAVAVVPLLATLLSVPPLPGAVAEDVPVLSKVQVEQALHVQEMEAENARLGQRLAAVEAQLAAATAATEPPPLVEPSAFAVSVRSNSTHATVVNPLGGPIQKVGPVAATTGQLEHGEIIGVMILIAFLFYLPFAKCCYRRCETIRHKVLPFVLIVNIAIFVTAVTRLKYITLNELFFDCTAAFSLLMKTVRVSLTGVCALVGMFVAWKLKGRALAVLEIEHGGILLGDFRDWATCWSMKRFHPIEIYVLKVEGLPSAHLLGENSVFAEASLGYNMAMRTRVHNSSGHKCLFKETMQLNFDPWDTDSRLHFAIKSQGIISSEIASVQIGAAKIRALEQEGPQDSSYRSMVCTSRVEPTAWQLEHFEKFDMVPAGTLYLRFETVPVEPVWTSCFDCCCGWFLGGGGGVQRGSINCTDDRGLLRHSGAGV